MARTNRKFTNTFKLQVIEEVLSNRASGAQIARRFNLSSSSISSWLTAYRAGRLKPEATELIDEEHPSALRTKIEDLERMVGKLALENDLLKKANLLYQRVKHASSLLLTGSDLDPHQKHVEQSESPGVPFITSSKNPSKPSLRLRRNSGMKSRK